MPNVVATSECGYAFRLTFCHSANKNHCAQIISGYVPDSFRTLSLTTDLLTVAEMLEVLGLLTFLLSCTSCGPSSQTFFFEFGVSFSLKMLICP